MQSIYAGVSVGAMLCVHFAHLTANLSFALYGAPQKTPHTLDASAQLSSDSWTYKPDAGRDLSSWLVPFHPLTCGVPWCRHSPPPHRYALAYDSAAICLIIAPDPCMEAVEHAGG